MFVVMVVLLVLYSDGASPVYRDSFVFFLFSCSVSTKRTHV